MTAAPEYGSPTRSGRTPLPTSPGGSGVRDHDIYRQAALHQASAVDLPPPKHDVIPAMAVSQPGQRIDPTGSENKVAIVAGWPPIVAQIVAVLGLVIVGVCLGAGIRPSEGGADVSGACELLPELRLQRIVEVVGAGDVFLDASCRSTSSVKAVYHRPTRSQRNLAQRSRRYLQARDLIQRHSE